MRAAGAARTKAARTKTGGRGRIAGVIATAVTSLALSSLELVSLERVAWAQVESDAPETLSLGEWHFFPSVGLRIRGDYESQPPDMGGVDLVGVLTPPVDDFLSITSRARLGLGVERSFARVQVTLQDARVWGSVGPYGKRTRVGVQGEVLAPSEAFVELRTSGVRPNFLRVGRQAVQWGEGMLLGKADWTPAGTQLDAVLGRYSYAHGEVEALAAVLAPPRPEGPYWGVIGGPFSFGTQLYGARASWAFVPVLKVEATGFARVASEEGASAAQSPFEAARLSGQTYTASLRVYGFDGPFDYGVEGVAQFGRAPVVAGGKDRRAFGATARATYLFERAPWTPRVRATFSYATGNEGGSTYGQLDPLVPDTHDRFGAMDLFAFSNILTPGARVSVVPLTGLTVTAEYDYFRLASGGGEWLNSILQPVGAGTAGGASELGNEVDVVVAYQPMTSLTAFAGYSMLFLGEGATAILASRGRGTPAPAGATTVSAFSQYAYVGIEVTAP